MGTPLQKLYDRFFSKIDEDLTGKEGQVFNLVDSAISKSYKTVRHSLVYVLDVPTLPATESYSGDFNDDLDSDELELLSFWMKYDWNGKKQQKLISMKKSIGTKDFNKLDDLPNDLKVINLIMQQTMDDIISLKNEFNTYQYN